MSVATTTLFGMPLDLLVLAGLTLALFSFGAAGGRRFSTSALLSLYISQVIVVVLPSLRGFLLRVGLQLPDVITPVAFVLSFLGTTWLLSGSAIAEIVRSARRNLEVLWHVGIMSVLGSALFGVLFFPLLPDGAYIASPIAERLLFTNPMPFLWVIAPVFFFVVLRAEK